jgi:HEAT repeat protein
MLITTLAAAAALALGHAPKAAPEVTARASAAAAPAVAQQDPADSAYRAAQARLADGDYRKAADAFARLRDKYPKSEYADDALYWRAFALSRAGGTDDLRAAREALAELRRAKSAAYRGDAAALDTRICGELAKRGDQRCAAVVSDIATAVDAVVAAAVDAASAGVDAAASAMSNPDVQAAVARAAAEGGRMAAEGVRAGAEGMRAAAEAMRDMRIDVRDDRGARRAQDCPDSDDDERVIALNAVMQMDAERAMPLLKRVMARRDKCSEVLRRKAVFIISQKRTDEAADILVDAARNDPDSEVREQSVYWLSRVPGEKSLTFLRDVATKAGNTEVRKKAIFALSNMSNPAARQTLRDVAAASGGDREVREEAIQWLGQRGSAEDVAWLREMYPRLDSRDLKDKVLFAVSRRQGNEQWLLDRALDTKEDIELRKQALFWAGQRKEISLDQLFGLYDRVTDREMKEQLIFVYSRRPEPQAVDRMISIAKNEKDKSLRSTAVQWLGRSKDPRAIEFLISLIDK